MKILNQSNQPKLNNYKPALKLLGYFSALLTLFCISNTAFAVAGDIGTVANTVTATMSSVAKLISSAAYVSGIAFALMGLMKFKAHKDNPQQTPLSQPIVLIVIAAGLVFLPSIIQSAGASLFAGGATSSTVQGTDTIQ